MNPDLFLNCFSRFINAPDAIRRIRHFILDLAVRGKVVEQSPESEKVGDSYSNEPVSDQLPTNWRLLNFGKYCDIQGGNQPPKSVFVDAPQPGYVRLFQIRDLGDNPVPTYIPATSTNRFCRRGEILIGRYGASVGKVFWAEDGAYNVALAKFIYPKCAFLPEFAFLALKSDFFQETLAGATRSAQAGFNKRDLSGINLPLPPVNEQRRIIAGVHELMAQCDALESALTERESKREKLAVTSFHRLSNVVHPLTVREHAHFCLSHLLQLTASPRCIQPLREAIFGLAVRGLLLPQTPTDEPATELLKRIRSEKTRFLRETKKKSKLLPPIDGREKPFSLPENWSWVRFGEIIIDADSGWSPKSEVFPRVGDNWGVLKVSAVSWNNFLPDENKQLLPEVSPPEAARVHMGDFLISRANTSELVAKSVIVEQPSKNLILSDKIVRLRISENCIKKFVRMVNNHAVYARAYYAEEASGTSFSMKNVSREVIYRLVVPLPPLAEQERIVAKVEELMTLCDRLETRLAAAQSEASSLLDAAINHTLRPFQSDMLGRKAV